MEKSEKTYGWKVLTCAAVLALVLGLAVGYVWAPGKTVEVEKQCPVCEKCTACEECDTCTNTEVPMDLKAQYVDGAVADLLAELEDEDLLVCGTQQYDDDQVVFRNLEEYSVSINDNGDVTVNLQGRLKYLDTDTEEKCYADINADVLYPADEDEDEPEITVY